jgi:hypothetical protein
VNSPNYHSQHAIENTNPPKNDTPHRPTTQHPDTISNQPSMQYHQPQNFFTQRFQHPSQPQSTQTQNSHLFGDSHSLRLGSSPNLHRSPLPQSTPINPPDNQTQGLRFDSPSNTSQRSGRSQNRDGSLSASAGRTIHHDNDNFGQNDSIQFNDSRMFYQFEENNDEYTGSESSLHNNDQNRTGEYNTTAISVNNTQFSKNHPRPPPHNSSSSTIWSAKNNYHVPNPQSPNRTFQHASQIQTNPTLITTPHSRLNADYNAAQHQRQPISHHSTQRNSSSISIQHNNNIDMFDGDGGGNVNDHHNQDNHDNNSNNNNNNNHNGENKNSSFVGNIDQTELIRPFNISMAQNQVDNNSEDYINTCDNYQQPEEQYSGDYNHDGQVGNHHEPNLVQNHPHREFIPPSKVISQTRTRPHPNPNPHSQPPSNPSASTRHPQTSQSNTSSPMNPTPPNGQFDQNVHYDNFSWLGLVHIPEFPTSDLDSLTFEQSGLDLDLSLLSLPQLPSTPHMKTTIPKATTQEKKTPPQNSQLRNTSYQNQHPHSTFKPASTTSQLQSDVSSIQHSFNFDVDKSLLGEVSTLPTPPTSVPSHRPTSQITSSNLSTTSAFTPPVDPFPFFIPPQSSPPTQQFFSISPPKQHNKPHPHQLPLPYNGSNPFHVHPSQQDSSSVGHSPSSFNPSQNSQILPQPRSIGKAMRVPVNHDNLRDVHHVQFDLDETQRIQTEAIPPGNHFFDHNSPHFGHNNPQSSYPPRYHHLNPDPVSAQSLQTPTKPSLKPPQDNQIKDQKASFLSNHDPVQLPVQNPSHDNFDDTQELLRLEFSHLGRQPTQYQQLLPSNVSTYYLPPNQTDNSLTFDNNTNSTPNQSTNFSKQTSFGPDSFIANSLGDFVNKNSVDSSVYSPHIQQQSKSVDFSPQLDILQNSITTEETVTLSTPLLGLIKNKTINWNDVNKSSQKTSQPLRAQPINLPHPAHVQPIQPPRTHSIQSTSISKTNPPATTSQRPDWLTFGPKPTTTLTASSQHNNPLPTPITTSSVMNQNPSQNHGIDQPQHRPSHGTPVKSNHHDSFSKLLLKLSTPTSHHKRQHPPQPQQPLPFPSSHQPGQFQQQPYQYNPSNPNFNGSKNQSTNFDDSFHLRFDDDDDGDDGDGDDESLL